mmetsp:Transcript_33002/g.94618  ORF Transcript_33002/g.94618 Transcript_33002/m.94618 type:complete len:267 (-) Transcript_33002:11-811(-)
MIIFPPHDFNLVRCARFAVYAGQVTRGGAIASFITSMAGGRRPLVCRFEDHAELGAAFILFGFPLPSKSLVTPGQARAGAQGQPRPSGGLPAARVLGAGMRSRNLAAAGTLEATMRGRGLPGTGALEGKCGQGLPSSGTLEAVCGRGLSAAGAVDDGTRSRGLSSSGALEAVRCRDRPGVGALEDGAHGPGVEPRVRVDGEGPDGLAASRGLRPEPLGLLVPGDLGPPRSSGEGREQQQEERHPWARADLGNRVENRMYWARATQS